MKLADTLFAFGLGCFLGTLCGDAMMWVYALGVTLFLSTLPTETPETKEDIQ